VLYPPERKPSTRIEVYAIGQPDMESPSVQAYLDCHDHAVKCAQTNRDLFAHRIKYCLFEKRPNLLDAEQGEDTDTCKIAGADES